MGRVHVLKDDDKVAVSGITADRKLHEGGEKWAVIHFVLRNGGRATTAEVNEHMRHDVRKTMLRLITDGWLVVVEAS